ncbi:MAG: hypothetical protein A2161_01685 [Candidatus Schekmanbacteria bacterium RBG_13_48_7]|uniref:Uncharacterized protein n=1 Tax=Candidatus Schekmanbacteria bacterium RBG_13_48_7 TaxID=1817878 RepID=A0A1F7S0J8_9BACT|nr:MAG: hypothetical protein A2161_01685 [Candidatus Schekmanbacteria bacterium RBG_13_48_7]
MKCPKCGSEKIFNDECLNCGILVSKYENFKNQHATVGDVIFKEGDKQIRADAAKKAGIRPRLRSRKHNSKIKLLLIIWGICIVIGLILWNYNILGTNNTENSVNQNEPGKVIIIDNPGIPEDPKSSRKPVASGSSVKTVEKSGDQQQQINDSQELIPTMTPDVFTDKVVDDHGHDESYWKEKYQNIQARIDLAQDQIEGLRKIIGELSQPVLIRKMRLRGGGWGMNYPGVEGTYIDGRVANLPEISKIERTIKELEKKLRDLNEELEMLQEECRKAGCLPGWIR